MNCSSAATAISMYKDIHHIVHPNEVDEIICVENALLLKQKSSVRIEVSGFGEAEANNIYLNLQTLNLFLFNL